MNMRTLALLLSLVSALFMGCAESGDSSGSGEQANGDAQRTEAFPVEVMTRFVVEGTNDLDERLHVDRLFMNVGAVLLDPVDGAAASFSSREPLGLEFDLSEGVAEQYGPDLLLPYGGAYAVTVQIEPTEVDVIRSKEAQPGSSVEVGGVYFVESPEPAVDEDEPSPLPWTPKEADKPGESDAAHSLAADTVPFSYTATDVVRFRLDEIQLDDEGQHVLTFVIRLDEWLEGDLLPALEQQDAERHPLQQLDVDAAQGDDDFERQVDGERVGFDALIGGMEASSARE